MWLQWLFLSTNHFIYLHFVLDFAITLFFPIFALVHLYLYLYLSVIVVHLQWINILKLKLKLHFNKIVSSIIWLWWFFDSWKTKQGCFLKIATPNISFLFISGLLSSVLSMTMLLAWCSSIKKSGPSNYDFPCLSHCKRFAGSISPLVDVCISWIHFPINNSICNIYLESMRFVCNIL